MFEKIFGIFRKKKKTDVSQDIAGDMGEETFGDDTGGLEEDFDADTISLETGASGDSGFSDSGSGVAAPSAPPMDEDFGGGLNLGEDTGVGLGEEAPALEAEGPISPPPEPETFAPSKRRGGGIKAVLTIAAVVILCIAAGFFGVRPAIQVVQKAMSKGPTPAEQLAAVDEENKQIEAQLKAYRALGDVDAIVAIRDEMKKRTDLQTQTNQIEDKVADQPYVENRLTDVSVQLEKTKLELVIEKGALANVEKAIKQVEARNEYLSSSAKENLQLITVTNAKADVIKERLAPEDVQKAEMAGSLHYSIRKELEESMSEAVPSS